MKTLILISLALGSIGAWAGDSAETWTVEGKVFDNKAQAIRYVMTLGKRATVSHTRCEILTNKLTFKACPKSKKSAFENEQFESLSKSE